MTHREVKAPTMGADHDSEAQQATWHQRSQLRIETSLTTMTPQERELSLVAGSGQERQIFVPEMTLAVGQKLIKHRARGEVCTSQSLSGLCGNESRILKYPKHSIGGQFGPMFPVPGRDFGGTN